MNHKLDHVELQAELQGVVSSYPMTEPCVVVSSVVRRDTSLNSSLNQLQSPICGESGTWRYGGAVTNQASDTREERV